LPAWQQLATLRPGARSTPAPFPSASPPPVEYLDDAGKLKRAEQLVTRRNLKDAERIVDDLIANDARNADFHAMRAYILYQEFTGDRPTRPLVDAIERALRLDEEHGRALYVKGLVLNRMGKRNEAIRYFQRALDAEPQNIEAQRELRLAKMRRDK
jgi:Tfp pilus assembly protein PilF